ncbi:MAG: purine-binding chemotaxis protein CheW [Deltaproteobacteria bacterium]|jgi:purine-binding chemotaxis protein CheW|nr:purine-binding chemotaxis protein CheW [Deltaproteobacteria bacterium]MBT4089894.1 purine-binding chemotaxis protein CheW [Deltaproteobacteria bacterium]MBT4266216.1 purine-binding chemotaxis protein CheW [Deltaproteobacteria bacterium]MBT4639050.1 purine-binding chemotaxis protein CheW [Deltaproteobacteria bacterium]MBT6501690.1 purine-binding chemotaxis protein CheW [Deltaproteobacteria bacterium]
MAPTQTTEKSDQNDLLQFSSFYLDGTLCGINIAQVQEINDDLNLTKVPLSPEYVMGIMNLRGQIVTIINLSMKIGFVPSEIGPKSRVVITSSKGEFIGLLVDQVTEVITVSHQQIANPPANIKGAQGKFFEGVFHTSNNELMALLNVEVVLDDES